jgi:hypothetical protein
MLLVYYGGADNVVCVAAAPLDEFLAKLKAGRTLELSSSGLPSFTAMPKVFAHA